MTHSQDNGNVILSAKAITKSFGGVVVVDAVDFDVRKGEILCLVGENGAGKSTLMRAIAGVIPFDSGEVVYKGEKVHIGTVAKAQSLGIGMIHQELNLVPARSVAQNIYLGREPKLAGVLGRLNMVDKKKLRADAVAALAEVGAKISPDSLLWDLTVGQQQLVEIAKALSMKAQVLFMDEPTSSLSEEMSENLLRLIRELRDRGIAIVFTTHRMPEAMKTADRFVVLRDGKKVADAPAKDVSLAKLVEWMVGRPMDQQYPKVKATVGDTVLSVQGLSGGMVKDVSFEVHAGEVLGFAGLVGAGRTETARLIFGADKLASGTIRLNGLEVKVRTPADAVKLGIGYVPEDRKKDALVLQHTVKDNMVLAGLDKLCVRGVVQEGTCKLEMERYIDRLSVKLRSTSQQVRRLSGGNQQKVVLCKWLILNPKVFILDEPTRGIDVGAKHAIYQLMNELAQEGIAVIFISSDLPEVLAMSDRVAVMSEGKLMTILEQAEATPERVMHHASGAAG